MASTRSAPAAADRVTSLSIAIARRSSSQYILHACKPAARNAAGGDRIKAARSSIHCLDVDQPVVAQLAEDEHLFRRALGEERDDG